MFHSTNGNDFCSETGSRTASLLCGSTVGYPSDSLASCSSRTSKFRHSLTKKASASCPPDPLPGFAPGFHWGTSVPRPPGPLLSHILSTPLDGHVRAIGQHGFNDVIAKVRPYVRYVHYVFAYGTRKVILSYVNRTVVCYLVIMTKINCCMCKLLTIKLHKSQHWICHWFSQTKTMKTTSRGLHVLVTVTRRKCC